MEIAKIKGKDTKRKQTNQSEMKKEPKTRQWTNQKYQKS